jgi:hypothetical protein
MNSYVQCPARKGLTDNSAGDPTCRTRRCGLAARVARRAPIARETLHRTLRNLGLHVSRRLQAQEND